MAVAHANTLRPTRLDGFNSDRGVVLIVYDNQDRTQRPTVVDDQPTGGWRRFLLAAYGPPLLSSIGYGAVTPLVALSALQLGASTAMAALITGLTGVATMIGDLPASWIATRLGEKRAIIAACLWDAIWLSVAFTARALPVLSLAVFCFGISGSVFGLARQTYVTEATPLRLRARALSGLGGVQRIGFFIGPLIASGIIAVWNLSMAYGFAAIMSLCAAGVTMFLPDLPADVAVQQGNKADAPKLWPILRHHLGVFARVGTGVLALMLVRQARQVILPLWCASLDMSESTTSLVVAASMGIDMSLFFFGGLIMDKLGRVWVAVPSMIVLGGALAALALTHSIGPVIAVAIVMGLGNGIGSGVVMTLGSDASPDFGRAQFLSGWRLMGDVGATLGPLAISAITALFSLAAATTGLGVFAWLGAIWLGTGITRSATTRKIPPLSR